MNRHVPPHDIDRQEAASFASRATPDFSRAARHSGRVRFLRRALPISLVVAVVILAAIPIIASFQVKIDLPFEVGHLTLSGTRLTMEAPKLSGFTDDNRGYNVVAKTASQDLTKPDLVLLSDIDAHLEMAGNGWAKLHAKDGTLNIKTQFVTLGGGVDLSMNGGYGGRLQDADVDVKKGSILTKKPVVFTYLEGKLVADRLTVSNRGEKALFEGNVQLDFRLSDLDDKSGAKAPRPPGQGAGPGGTAVAAQGQTRPAALAEPGSRVAPAAAALNLPAMPLPPRRPAQVR